MSYGKHVAVRLDEATLARVECIRERMSGPAARFGILLSQSDALRAAIVAGLSLLEQEYGVEPGPSTPDPASRKQRPARAK